MAVIAHGVTEEASTLIASAAAGDLATFASIVATPPNVRAVRARSME
jgi:hypothetical protein